MTAGVEVAAGEAVTMIVVTVSSAGGGGGGFTPSTFCTRAAYRIIAITAKNGRINKNLFILHSPHRGFMLESRLHVDRHSNGCKVSYAHTGVERIFPTWFLKSDTLFPNKR